MDVNAAWHKPMGQQYICIDIHADRTDRQTDMADRRTDRQIDRQTGQTDIQSDRQGRQGYIHEEIGQHDRVK